MTTKANEEIIYAPIEIESADQLHALGATWDDCRTWTFGVTPVKVYLVQADEATRDFLVSELERKYTKRFRDVRCMIPGKIKAWIRCPECNKCSACPYGRSADDHEGTTVSLDYLMENGYESATGDVTAEQAENELLLDEILDKLRRLNPAYVDIIQLKAAGYSTTEIASKLGISQPTGSRMLRRIQKLTAE